MNRTPRDDDRVKNGGKSVPRDERGPGAPLSAEAAEKRLLAQLQDKAADPRRIWHQSVALYSGTARYDKAISGLRQLMALEPNVERKAECVLAMGGNAEKQGDYPAAVCFYREAMAMEPTRKGVWYFIHNNLGFSLNMLGEFADGERFCRAALDIDPGRPNAHKNLGLALQGQERYLEAAECFIRATGVCPSDPRASQLLRGLLNEHRELEFEFGAEAEQSEEAVRFAEWAIQRALTGNVLRVVLACNEPILDDLIAVPLGRITGGAVEMLNAGSWAEILQAIGPGPCDLVFVIPENLAGAPWRGTNRCLRTIKARGTKAMIVAGTADELNEHRDACQQAGADHFVEMPFMMDFMEATLRRCLVTE